MHLSALETGSGQEDGGDIATGDLIGHFNGFLRESFEERSRRISIESLQGKERSFDFAHRHPIPNLVDCAFDLFASEEIEILIKRLSDDGDARSHVFEDVLVHVERYLWMRLVEAVNGTIFCVHFAFEVWRLCFRRSGRGRRYRIVVRWFGPAREGHKDRRRPIHRQKRTGGVSMGPNAQEEMS